MCTSVLSSRVSDCEPLNQSFVKTDASWISYTNETEPNGYIIHSHCPFDYCLPPSNAVRINFNMANGADAQCNHNRHGILCYARYWTSLLLLVRIILYLITILNFNRNPHVQLTATAFAVGALLTIQGLYTKPVYRKSALDAMETIIYFNIIAFTAFTAYTLESNGNQVAIATVSTSVTPIMLIAVLAYHVYTYTCMGRLLRKLDCHKRLLSKL